MSISLPRKVLVPLVPHIEHIFRHLIPPESEALQLLKGYVNTIGETPVPARPELRRLIVAISRIL